MKGKQIVFTEINKAELLDFTCERPGAGQVTVRNMYSAISSGTERANITGNPNNGIGPAHPVVFPRELGYSACGTVEEIGEGVTRVAPGDKVVVFWGLHKSRITISEDNVCKIPDGVSMQEAAIAFISTFPLAAVRKTKIEIGESAIVMGLGILGVFAVELLHAAGACPVIAVDPVASRREFALTLGADFALDPTEPDFTDTVKSLTNGGAKVAIEVTGLGQGFIQALDCMARFGRVALLGCTRDPNFHVDYYRKIHGPGITVIGAHTLARPKVESAPGYWTDRDDLDAVLRLLVGKRLDYSKLIKEIHAPEECGEVYTRLINDRNFPVGVLFDWTKINGEK